MWNNSCLTLSATAYFRDANPRGGADSAPPRLSWKLRNQMASKFLGQFLWMFSLIKLFFKIFSITGGTLGIFQRWPNAARGFAGKSYIFVLLINVITSKWYSSRSVWPNLFKFELGKDISQNFWTPRESPRESPRGIWVKICKMTDFYTKIRFRRF